MFSNVRTVSLHRVVALACLLAGCVGADPAEHFCSAANKREEKCHTGSALIDDATCARVLRCDHALYVPESDGVRLRCAAAFADASCSDQPSSLMECDLELLRQAVSGMKKTTVRESFEAGCLAKAAECQELGIDIMPVCSTASAMTDAMNSAMQRCNQGDCQQYGRCVAEEMSNAYEACLQSVP